VNRYQELDQPLDSDRRVTSAGQVPTDSARASGDYDELLAEAIEVVGLGIILIAADGWILYANRMARDLVQSGRGLRSSYGRLVAMRSEGGSRLSVLTKLEAEPTADTKTKSQIIALPRGEGVQHLFAHIVAGRPRFEGATIFIVDLEHYAIPRLDAFSLRYGLTPSEARVLNEIVSGQGLVAAARSLDIAESTARTHLRRVFSKTGAGRQTELLHLYLTGGLPGAQRIGNRS
jgi:DNA-binding CsgD family transcriptional regulator